MMKELIIEKIQIFLNANNHRNDNFQHELIIILD